ncbi:MAG: hypothetical protein V4560_16305 [Bacteroidota bacterium]
MIKKTLILISCIFSLSTQAQQKLNTFHLVDEETGLAIPSVSIAIVKARLSITTEKDGIFNIPGDLNKMRDTIIFSRQNYTSLKMPLRGLNGMDTIKLRKVQSEGKEVKTSFKNDTLLNNYEKLDIGYYAGLHTGYEEFNYLQLAEQFQSPKAGAMLKNVTINRLAFYLNKVSQYNYTEMEHTKFRIRVYDIDPVTGGPGKDLCNEIIEVKSNDQKKMNTNLKSYKIIIPNKTFFVAVEWLRDFYNLGLVQIYSPELKKTVNLVNYRPAIGLSPIKGKKLNIWALNINNEWKLYTYHSPDFTDLAIKAAVQY